MIDANAIRQRWGAAVLDAILRANSSTRLRNVARSNVLLAEWAIGRALADPETFQVQCFQLQNLGRTTMQELLELLQTAPAEVSHVDTGRSDTLHAVEPAAPRLTANIDPEMLPVSLGAIIRFSECSVRLSNALVRAALDDVCVADYLADRAILMSRLSQLQGIGRKSIDEAVAIWMKPSWLLARAPAWRRT